MAGSGQVIFSCTHARPQVAKRQARGVGQVRTRCLHDRVFGARPVRSPPGSAPNSSTPALRSPQARRRDGETSPGPPLAACGWRWRARHRRYAARPSVPVRTCHRDKRAPCRRSDRHRVLPREIAARWVFRREHRRRANRHFYERANPGCVCASRRRRIAQHPGEHAARPDREQCMQQGCSVGMPACTRIVLGVGKDQRSAAGKFRGRNGGLASLRDRMHIECKLGFARADDLGKFRGSSCH